MGVLLDIGMYTIQFANWVYNNERPESIKAAASLTSDGEWFYDIGMYTIQFANWVYNNERPESIKAAASLASDGEW